MLVTKNPATGELLAEYPEMSDAEVARELERAERGFPEWARRSVEERAEKLRALAERLGEEDARRITLEMGKPIRQARAEVEKCAWMIRYMCEKAPEFLAQERVEMEAEAWVRYAPLGVILGIMPWNFPYWQVLRFAVPALLAGNAVVIKHAENVTGCAQALQAHMEAIGLGEVYRTLYLKGGAVARWIGDPRIRGVSLTGSTETGKVVAQYAGRALKKTVLELGGSDPYLILEDAPLEAVVETCARSRLQNSGQSCIAAKRFIVLEPILEDFVERLRARFSSAVVGDPMEETTEVGPLAREDLRRQLHALVASSVEAGARCIIGGEIPEGRGYFYPPTILLAEPSHPVAREETFGPVAVVLRARSEKEAVELANGTHFGLGAGVFTADRERGRRIAEQLEAGIVFVNDFVRSDPRLPFGGVKESGYGRELGVHGIREWTNIQSLVVS